jgi:signal transduction histidine kinase
MWRQATSIRQQLTGAFIGTALLALFIGVVAWGVFSVVNRTLSHIVTLQIPMQQIVTALVVNTAQMTALAPQWLYIEGEAEWVKLNNDLSGFLTRKRQLVEQFDALVKEDSNQYKADFVTTMAAIIQTGDELEAQLIEFKKTVHELRFLEQIQTRKTGRLMRLHQQLSSYAIPMMDDVNFQIVRMLDNAKMVAKESSINHVSLRQYVRALYDVSELRSETNSLAGLLETGANIQLRDHIAPLKERAESSLMALKRAMDHLSAFPEQRQNEAHKAFNGLSELTKGNQNIFLTQQTRLSLEEHLRKQIGQLESTRDVLNSNLRIAIMKMESGSYQLAKRTSKQILIGKAAIIVSVGISLLLAWLMAYKYLQRRVLSRLEELKRIMNAISQNEFDVELRDTSQDEIGQMGRVLMVFRDRMQENVDLTKHLMAANKESQALSQIPHHSPHPIIQLSSRGEVTLTNPAAEHLFHGIKDLQCRHPVLLGINIQALPVEQALTREITYERKTYLQTIQKITDKNQSAIIVVYSNDISYVKDTMQALKQAKLKADETNRQLATASAAALVAQQAAEHANQMKSEFLSNMSHELRTPMHSIISFSRQGISRIDRWGREDKLQNLQLIHDSGKRLLSLINNLLDLSKLEAGAMTYDMQPHDLSEITMNVLNQLQAIIQDKGLVIEKPSFDQEIPKVLCDSGKIMQVVVNLLSNAIKFTPQGRHIWLRLKPHNVANGEHEKEKRYVELIVQDEGIGIPEGELQSVFDKFVQSSKTKTGAGGTGLGLAITREIINDHGGRIWASNHPSGGACFTIWLPEIEESASTNQLVHNAQGEQ